MLRTGKIIINLQTEYTIVFMCISESPIREEEGEYLE